MAGIMFLCFFEFEVTASSHAVDKTNAIGLDYASDGLYVDSNGNVGTNQQILP